MPSYVLLVCDLCNNQFQRSSNDLSSGSRKKSKHTFCSRKCFTDSLSAGRRLTVPCGHCGREVSRIRFAHRTSKSGHVFCNHACAVTYSNTHKTTGIRRSKLEMWLEARLRVLYPDLTLLACDKTTINSELDLYFPGLKLAFELNGIFHYEPIYGPEKLAQIQNNDHRKFAACVENNISLCIIDSSHVKHFKESKAVPFLELMVNIIDQKLAEVVRLELTTPERCDGFQDRLTDHDVLTSRESR